MAGYNEILVGRYSEVLRRVLNMAGTDATAPQLEDAIRAGLVLESDRFEWFILGATQLCCGESSGGPVAAENAFVQFFNPAQSNVIAVFDPRRLGPMVAEKATAAAVSVIVDTTSRGTLVTSRAIMDSRDGGFATTRRPVVQVRQGTNAGLAGNATILRFNVRALTMERFETPAILAPGFGLTVWNETANEAIRVGSPWYERALAPSEQL